MTVIAAPTIDPSREKLRMRPIKAWKHMQKLLSDKEDTEQVFHIIESLNGNHLVRLLEDFAKSPKGARLLEERRYLPPILDDHSWISELPENTVGRAYIDFMEREGLTAAGLVAESQKMLGKYPSYGDDLEWLGNHLRDTHDLFHVLSGYGRDALGEASLLAFTNGQHGGRGLLFIAFMGCRRMRAQLPRHIDVMGCFREGRRNGKASQRFIEEDIVALLEEDLESARERLGVRTPVKYHEAIRLISELGDANDLLAAV